jgi:hypothetical protein
MYSICVLYKTCLAWWWHINKVESRCSIKHILSYVDCYYVISSKQTVAYRDLHTERSSVVCTYNCACVW